MKWDRKLFLIVCILMVFAVIVFGSISARQFGNKFRIVEEQQTRIAADDGWTDRTGNEVDLTHLQNIDGISSGVSYSVFYNLPDSIKAGTYLSFRTKNILVSAYIDDECIYHAESPDPALNSKAFGTNWHSVLIPTEAAGQVLELRITTSYEGERAAIDTIYFDTAAGYVLSVIYEKAFAIITCILFMFVGILLILINIPVNMGQAKNYELTFLGLFSILIAAWCFTSTYIIPLFTGDGRTNHIVSCYLLGLIPLGAIMYLYEAFGEKFKIPARILMILSVLEFIVNTILQLSGKADVQQTLVLSHVMVAVSGLIFFVLMFVHVIQESKKSAPFFRWIRALGLGGVGLTATIDIIRFYVGSGVDDGRYVRIGLLVFIVCYGGASMERSIDTFRMGAKAEIISHLAYQDGLTELGNRTLFDECLDRVEAERQREHIEIGIVMFDVNNLKVINDSFGHQMGDQLLKTAAEIIKKTFGEQGECFRVGGDEFVAIITGANVMERCEEARKQCEKIMEDMNNGRDKPFYVRIAIGYNVYIPGQSTHQSLKEIYRLADSRMYEAKKKMKADHPDAPVCKKGETAKLNMIGNTGKLKNMGETSRLFGRTGILRAEDNPFKKS